MSLAEFRIRVIQLLDDYVHAVLQKGGSSLWERNIASQIGQDPWQVATVLRRDLHTGLCRNYKFTSLRDHFGLYEVGWLFEFHLNELYPLGSDVDKAYNKYVGRRWIGMDEMPRSTALTTLQIRLSGLAFCSNLRALPPASNLVVTLPMPEDHMTRPLNGTILGRAVSKAFWKIKHVLLVDNHSLGRQCRR